MFGAVASGVGVVTGLRLVHIECGMSEPACDCPESLRRPMKMRVELIGDVQVGTFDTDRGLLERTTTWADGAS